MLILSDLTLPALERAQSRDLFLRNHGGERWWSEDIIRGSDMRRRYIVAVEGVPPSPSPISNAVVVGNQCWISGQLSVGDDGAYIPGSTAEEAKRAFAHVFRIAEAAGFSAADIVYVDLAFIDLADVTDVNRLFAELFPEGQRPARTIYQAAMLPFGGRIKVQAVAAR